jgi:hypothetical protein
MSERETRGDVRYPAWTHISPCRCKTCRAEPEQLREALRKACAKLDNGTPPMSEPWTMEQEYDWREWKRLAEEHWAEAARLREALRRNDQLLARITGPPWTELTQDAWAEREANKRLLGDTPDE